MITFRHQVPFTSKNTFKTMHQSSLKNLINSGTYLQIVVSFSQGQGLLYLLLQEYTCGRGLVLVYY